MDDSISEDKEWRRCSEHMVADGEVERSAKTDGIVKRVRRCKECGGLFNTFEMTEDQVARQNGEHDTEIRDLKRELKFYQDVARDVKRVLDIGQGIKDSLLMEYNFGSEDRD